MSFPTRRYFIASIFLPVSRAQQPVFTAEVNLVNILATVRDKKGRIVTDLPKEEFLVEDQGRPQEILYFGRESDLPLSLGLLVDVSGSQRRIIEEERKASRRFLARALRGGKDLACLIQFAGEVELVQDITASTDTMMAGVQLIGQSLDSVLGNSSGRPTLGRGARVGSTSLYDAILLSAQELKRTPRGRRAIIVLSDGVDTASKVSMDAAITATQRADTLVYAIRFVDEDANSRQPPRWNRGTAPLQDGALILDQIASETGGAQYAARGRLDNIFDDIERELRSHYVLGYKPDENATRGEFREIRVTTRQRSLFVRTRRGYIW